MSERAIFVVDRLEGATAVLVADIGARQMEVPRRALPKDARREGAVLRVVVDDHGQPDWSTAAVDREEERLRIEDARKQLEKLKRTDPGGDLSL